MQSNLRKLDLCKFVSTKVNSEPLEDNLTFELEEKLKKLKALSMIHVVLSYLIFAMTID